jgi:prevent-host-death family protein
MTMKQSVGARELKTRLGRYLRRVRQGATLIVTDRGEPVAELRPLSTSAAGDDAPLKQLVALGVITRERGLPLKPFKRIRVKGKPLSHTLIEEREDRL